MQYSKERQAKTKAFCQLRSWLETTRIPYTSSGYSIVIKVKPETNLPDDASVDVNVKEINNKNLDRAVKEFYKVTIAGGYGTPNPIVRGPKTKARHTNAPELVAFRHNEFRRVYNPPLEKLKAYEPVGKSALGLFLSNHFYQCKHLGLDKEDLMTYIQVWTCNYLGLYELQDPGKNENEKRLYAYLRQRLMNLVKVLNTKNKSCSYKAETPIDVDDEDSDTSERSMALVKNAFNAMSKESRIKVLMEVAENEFIHDEIRKTAKRKLKKELK